MNEILCSTGALIGKPNGRDYTLLEKLAGELSCDGFEFMMYSSWYEQADRLTDALRGTGLSFPVMHCEKHIGEKISRGEAGDLEEALRLFRINCRIAQSIGAEKLVLHLWDGMISDSHFENNLAAYAQLKEIADSHGLLLLVENVVCNHEDPMTHWCALREQYADVRFVFDTKMAAFHGQMDLLYDREYEWLWRGGHIAHFHVNDYGGGYMEWDRLKTLPIGGGNVDFVKFFSFVKDTGYEGMFTVEATAFNREGVVDTGMLNRCFEEIRGRI